MEMNESGGPKAGDNAPECGDCCIAAGILRRMTGWTARHATALLLLAFATLVACQTAATVEEMEGAPAPSEIEAPAPGDSTISSTPAEAEADPAPPAATVAVSADYEKRWKDFEFVPEMTSSCFYCHETLSRRYGRPARQHITSAHYRAGVTCHECHGGNPEEDIMEDAHDTTMGFMGKLEPEQMVKSCGECHPVASEKFVASKHHPAHENVRQVTCIECHSSHDIGSRPDTFSWKATCLDCHSLDHVPDLPVALTDMMLSKDGLHEQVRKYRYKNGEGPFPPEVMEPYREVRQLTADVVHSTQAEGIEERMIRITEKNRALEETIRALVGG